MGNTSRGCSHEVMNFDIEYDLMLKTMNALDLKKL